MSNSGIRARNSKIKDSELKNKNYMKVWNISSKNSKDNSGINLGTDQ